MHPIISSIHISAYHYILLPSLTAVHQPPVLPSSYDMRMSQKLPYLQIHLLLLLSPYVPVIKLTQMEESQ